MHYQLEYIRCGKKRCKACPHGPYWYGYWRVGSRIKSKYFGKKDPREKPAHEEPPKSKYRKYWDEIFDRSSATDHVAKEILGVSFTASLSECKTAFRLLTKELHSDRGGDENLYRYVVAAWTFLSRFAS